MSDHENRSGLNIRDASMQDLPALTQIKAPTALHRDRIRDADLPGFRYLVLEKDGNIIGFACLVFVRPPSWPDAGDTVNLPQIVDLVIATEQRRRGYGSLFIQEIEKIATWHGKQALYLSVDIPVNMGAHALYLRLGYRQIQSKPYPHHWKFTDSDGVLHQGDGWVVDLCKSL